MATTRDKRRSVLAAVDWATILIYVCLLALGWMSVVGASYDYEQGANFLDFSTRSGMQIVWIGTSLLLGSLILSIDERVYNTFAYLIYLGFLALLFVTPLLAHDIKGSLSWIKIGSFSIQPAEFAKFGTALCVSKFMSRYGFSMSRWTDALGAFLLILVPMLLIVLQRETGSALVYLAFFLMLYREGMAGSILFAGIAAVVYFVVGVRFAHEPLMDIPQTSLGAYAVLLCILGFAAGMLYIYTPLRRPLWQVGGTALGLTALATMLAQWAVPFDVATFVLLPLAAALTLWLLWLALRDRMARYLWIALFTLGSVGFHYSSNFVMDHVLEPHQQMRIRVLLGMEDDPRGAGYNVIQAKIAIGSGGLRGKGFLNGTQTKLKYVPEQDTDFIFCTVGEEEGFVGCAIVLGLFLALILRLIALAERQSTPMERIYGYCVMSVFLFHVFINVGMVLGLTPVIGIPLPFFSYGGSSLWGFTILLFIFLRMDATRLRRG